MLAHQLAAEYRLLMTSFVDSSARNHPDVQRLSRLFRSDGTEGGVVADRNAFQLAVTVIWKIGGASSNFQKPSQLLVVSVRVRVSSTKMPFPMRGVSCDRY